MTAIKKTTVINENPDDPNVRDPEHKHELGGTLGMTVGGVAGGIAAGAAAGAAIGGMAGPVGAVIGAGIGGAIGGSAGEEIARQVNPTAEEAYWEEHYRTRPYAADGSRDFETYRPAYRYGVEAYSRFGKEDAEFETIEQTLDKDWAGARGVSTMDWSEARGASRDAYERLRERNKRS